MTEVKDSQSFGSRGLFASKTFAPGDVILRESPVLILAPTSEEEDQSILSRFFGDLKCSPNAAKGEDEKPTLWNLITPPESISKESRGLFRGMVQAGLCWMSRSAKLSKEDQDSILELYYPEKGAEDVPCESTALDIAAASIHYLKEICKGRTKSDQEIDWETIEKVLLIWACNSFQGGRIYAKISRINHDCNPNAIIQADGDIQKVVAATTIAAGEEISISYLGLLLYTERKIRKEKLKSSKFFECKCSRCQEPTAKDIAALIPCPNRHPRELPQQSLEEEVQYDDDQDVHYVVAASTESDNPKLHVVMNNVLKKVSTYLNSQEQTMGSTEDDDADDSILEDHLGLSSAILGDRHWATNLLKLIHLNRRLSQMSQLMLTTQELPDLDEVAEAIDSLQRIERFVDALNLKLGKGHVLGDVIIGVARTLVSLGDTKSQKYGAEWLEKVGDYFDLFEKDGVQKVVTALKGAWKASEDEEGQPPKKKSKS